MRISDWSSDVCSSDLDHARHRNAAERARQGVGMESLCATRGADDVVVWIFVRAAVPAGRRHARLLAQGKRYRVERYHHDRQLRHDLCAGVYMGTISRSLASSRFRTAGSPFALAYDRKNVW